MGKRKARIVDVFEAEDAGSDDEIHQNPKYDRVQNFQYELPENFDDEEIDEDEAFNEDDNETYGHIFGSRKSSQANQQEAEEDAGELTRDDFSDDDSEADRVYGRPQSRKQPAAKRKQASKDDSDMDEIFGQDASDDESDSGLDSDSELDPAEAARIKKLVAETVQAPKKKKQKTQQKLKDEAVPESEYNLSAENDVTGELTVADLLAGLGAKSGKMTKAEKQLAQLAKQAKPVEAPLPNTIRARKSRQVGYEDTKKDITKWQPIIKANREAPTLVFSGPTNQISRTNTTASLTAKFQPKSTMEAEVAELLKAAGLKDEATAAQAEETLALQTASAEEIEKRQNELAKMRSLLYKHESKAKHLAKIKSKDYHRRLKKSAKAKAEKAGELGDKDFIRLQAEQAEYDRAKERLTLKHKNSSQWARRALRRGVHEHADDGKKEALAEQLRIGEELRRRVDKADSVEGSDTDDSAATGGGSDSSDSEGDSADEEVRKSKRAKKLRNAANDILDEGEDDVDVSKGLFSLPFMKRAAEKQRKAAEKDARELLAELDGVANDEAPKSGRRNFGLAGGVQVGDDNLSEDEAVQSDEDEDAEAKRERLKHARQEEQRLANHNANTSQNPELKPSQASRPQQAGTGNGCAADSEDDSDEGWGLGPTKFPTFATDGPVRVTDMVTNGHPPPSEDVSQLAGESRCAETKSKLRSDTDYLLKGKDLVKTQRPPVMQAKAKKGPTMNGVTVGPGKQPGKGGNEDPEALGMSQQASESPQQPEFLPSLQFSGTKAGYVFTKGPKGVGYYLEQSASDKQKATKKAKPQSQKTAEKLEKEHAEDPVAQAAVLDFAEASEDEAGEQEGMSQRALIAQAFAGDDVVAEFQAEKDDEVGKELPKTEAPSLLPGWGTWADSQKEPQWMIAAKAKIERQRKAALAGRRDAKLQNVVISERFDKKAAKYNVATLPFPYTSKAAFEGNMRQPLGAEFNTQTSFRHMNRPSILKSTGVIIKPLQFNQHSADNAVNVSKTSNRDRPAISKVSGGLTQAMKARKGIS